MKKRIVAILTAAAFALAFAIPAVAHSAPPCNDSGEPGNSDYAQHHIRSLATTGGLGDGGHKPGSHQGFSVCNPSGK